MYNRSVNSTTRSLPDKLDPDASIPHADDMVQTSLEMTDSKHKCGNCSAGFNTKKLLKRHITQVHKMEVDDDCNAQYRWKCSHCMLRWRTRDLKNEHQRQCCRSKGADDVIETKESEFVDYNDFDGSEMHSGSEANNGDDFDDDDSKCKVNLSAIIDTSTASETWKCKKCSDCFPTYESLQIHESNQHADSKLFTNVNIKEERLDFDDIPLKTENENTDNDNALAVAQPSRNCRWTCKTCQKAFETRELLRTHRRNHSGIRKVTPVVRNIWSCNICDAVLTSRDKVRIHKNINHPDVKRERRSNDEMKNWGDVGEYECELCNKSYISKSKIRKHMDVHKNKDRPKRLCTICGLELCSTYNLNNHIRTVHGRERKFHCQLCDRRFSHSHHLKTHMNRHDNIRPFQCEQCVKSFFDKTTLREHVKSVHLNLKAYACKICSRTFNRSGNMRAHMLKTHSLGDLGDVNRSFGNASNNEPMNVDTSDDFTPTRIFSNSLGEPFRLMIMKSSVSSNVIQPNHNDQTLHFDKP